MQGPETILGYGEYDGVRYPFIYDNGILKLLPSTEEEWNTQKQEHFKNILRSKKNSDFSEPEWVVTTYIKGVTQDHKNILFISTTEPSILYGFIYFNIHAIYEYYPTAPNNDLIIGLIITAEEINYFFDPSNVYDYQILQNNEDNSIQEITIQTGKKTNQVVKCGSYTTNDVKVEIELSAHSKYKHKAASPFLAESRMCLEFDKPVDINIALAVVREGITFLNYVCYRQNINLSKVSVFSRNEKGQRRINGNVYLLSEQEPETNIHKSKKLITFNLIKDKIAAIFQEISSGKLYLSHLCKNITATYSYNTARIILLFAAFEREYNNFLSNIPNRSPQYLQVKQQAISVLDNIECVNSKSKKYVRRFKNLIEKDDTRLSDRIKYVLERHNDIIDIFIKYYYHSLDENLVDELSQRLNTMRNDIAHGNFGFQIEPIHISDLILLEILIYAIRLKALNIDSVAIKKAIQNLFGTHIKL